jgi:hypothetical protein
VQGLQEAIEAALDLGQRHAARRSGRRGPQFLDRQLPGRARGVDPATVMAASPARAQLSKGEAISQPSSLAPCAATPTQCSTRSCRSRGRASSRRAACSGERWRSFSSSSSSSRASISWAKSLRSLIA